ncbi:MAG: SDR family NAD(P)-dependent oxidoreductase [Akkermansiaceae bacterium]|nr:SDR family NAD(P)-dependent oxidoreductase [Akkermansiaceae bacterium]
MKVVVTGAAGGLGQAITSSFSGKGGEVLAPGKDELDVSSPGSVKVFFESIDDVELLVCNAGITIDKTIAKMTEEDWSRVIDVNLKGAFLCAREVSRAMAKRRAGHILFISSFSALHPPSGQANYSASKSALLGMMKSMAQEFGRRNVRVNAVIPGFMETKMTAPLSDQIKQDVLNRHVLGRYNTPEAVAEFIVHLHQHMPHTSGQTFNLDSRISGIV